MSRSRQQRSRTPGFRRLPRIADLMTPELSSFYDRSAAAERVGDAEEALAYHSGIPMFRRSRHRGILEQLIAAKDELTPWIIARWIVYQALRCEDPGSRTGTLVRGALQTAVATFHADRIEETYVEGGDPVRVTATVLGGVVGGPPAGLGVRRPLCVSGRVRRRRPGRARRARAV